jgi:RND family efflux transporter MFP subunit
MGKRLRRLIQFFLVTAFIIIGVVGFNALKASKPQIQKRKTAPSVPFVRVIKVTTAEHLVQVKGEGTVQPLRESKLVPQVSGNVIYISPSLVDGGEFSKGGILLRIEPEDYRLAVTLAEAKVKDTESKLELAKEEAAAAREEWRLLYPETADGENNPPPLVAKEPQLRAVQARLEADRADLRKAQLNLERTELRAPFEGRVSEESVDIGQYVTHGQALATLYSTEAAEIVVPLEIEDLLWFHVPGFTQGNGSGSPAIVSAQVAGMELSWQGEVVRTEGRLDQKTRMINVVIHVERPYAQRPPLIFGLFVKVHIQGHTLTNAAIVPRAALRQEDQVWVVDDTGKLRFRKVEVVRIQGEEVLIKSGIEDGEKLVVSSLKAVSDRMAVKAIPMKEEGGQ